MRQRTILECSSVFDVQCLTLNTRTKYELEIYTFKYFRYQNCNQARLADYLILFFISVVCGPDRASGTIQNDFYVCTVSTHSEYTYPT